jgi:hypothetical protein
MCDLVLGDHHQSTRIPIETVNDPRTQWSADRRQSVGPGQESVDESTGRVTRRRVDDQTRRLVDDEEKFVFVYDRNWNGLRLDGEVRRWRKVDLQLISGAWAVALPHRLSAQKYPSVVNQRRHPISAQVQPLGKKGVETDF